MKSNEVGLDLRETPPLPRDIVHSPEGAFRIDGVANEANGKRLARGLSRLVFYQLYDSHRQPDLSCWRAGDRKERDWSTDNHHLPYLVESLAVNVGGSGWEGSSHSMKSGGVGGVRVVGARESRVQGEAAIRSLDMTRCVRAEGRRAKRALITWGS